MRFVSVFKLTETPLQSGTSLVEASAGTGKTFTIAGLFLRLILEKNLSVREILVVTYTVAATEELRHRIRQTLAKALKAFTTGESDDSFLQGLLQAHAGQREDMVARLGRALYGFDEAPIFTIHGFCQRVLKDRAFETGNLFDTELVTDQATILRQLVEDYWRKEFYRASKVPVVFALKNGLNPLKLLPLINSSLCHPFLKLLSPVGDRTVKSLAEELEQGFHTLREIWQAEGPVIRSHFGAGAKWANKPYNSADDMAEAFGEIDHCFTAADFAPAALASLMQFRTSAIVEKLSKRAKLPAPKHRFFELCEELSQTEERYVIAIKLHALLYVQHELPRRKNELKIQFYDDLLTRLHRTLVGDDGKVLAAELRRQYAAALIDEFQDTDPMQYQIFQGTFDAPGNYLFLIGDPKQAIYGFRGADIFTYLKASEQANQSYTLKENWRSETGLVHAVNTFFSASSLPFMFSGIQFHSVEARGEADKHPLQVDGRGGPALHIWFWNRVGNDIKSGVADKELPQVVASQIVALLQGDTRLGERGVLPEDIAVLVPQNRQAQLIQDALKLRNIPSVLYTSASLFESREMLETQRVLTAIADPSRESQLMAALGTDLLGHSGMQIEALAQQEEQWQEILERFRDYLALWIEKGFVQMFRSLMQREQIRPRLLAFPDGERRLTNLLHISEVLHRASLDHRLGATGLLKWIVEQRQTEGQVAEEHQLRLETDEKAVKLVTIHKSKGLEYSIVFCPYSWKGTSIEHDREEQVFFHENKSGLLTRDLGSADYATHVQQAKVEKLAENVRLLYVALTRAKHRCYLVWGAFNGAGTSAPAWLLHAPPTSEPNAVEALETHFKQLDDARLLEDLNRLAGKSGDAMGNSAIQITDLPQPNADKFEAPVDAGLPLDWRKSTATIPRDWRINSFTSLTANHGNELPDYDETGTASRASTPVSGIFAFPGGTKPGACLHSIFEKLDFVQSNRPATKLLVQEQLRAHGIAESEFTDVIVEMLGKVMETTLDENVPGLTLSKISAEQRLHELEFYFPLGKISPAMLGKVLQAHHFFNGQSKISREPEGLSFVSVRGMLKGFIDLVFEFNGRFYLAGC
jgi:exodeoxyribonuclease V beta subunit